MITVHIYDNDGDLVDDDRVLERVPVAGDFIEVNDNIYEVWRVLFPVRRLGTPVRIQLSQRLSPSGRQSKEFFGL